MAGVAAAYRHSLGSDDGREGRDGRAVQLGCRAVLHCTRAAIGRTTAMHERPRTLEASLQQMQRMQQERRRGAGGGAGQEMTGLSGEV